MAEAAMEEKPRTVAELDRLIKAELTVAEVVAKPNYAKAGEYLTALRPLVPPRSWMRHLLTLDLSLGRATRYMGYHAKLRAYEEGRSTVKPTRITPRGKHPEDQHHAKGYAAWKAQREAQPRTVNKEAERKAAHRLRVHEVAGEIVTAGYRKLATDTHPDAGGSGDGSRMALLKDAKELLNRLLGMSR